ncbi:hypothetical protein [uncultured Methylobacterium sp.]|uniref:hypothetical protein n=1 Tax=uncultured Methylobacterium sp. TaxID=157278 RepID=UPI0035CA0B02
MRQSFTVFAALLAASLVATPLVISATNALATSEHTETAQLPAAVTVIDVAPVAAPVVAETCQRKVRVVYAGYAAPGCTTSR